MGREVRLVNGLQVSSRSRGARRAEEESNVEGQEGQEDSVM